MPNFASRLGMRTCAGLTAGLMLAGIVPTVAATNANAAEALQLAAAATASVDAGNASALISWTPTDGASGYQVKVYNATTGALVTTRPSATSTTTATAASYTVTGLLNGTQYNLVLVAKTASGDVLYPSVAVTPKAVANRPTLSTTVTGGSGQLTYKWTAATVPTGTPAVTGYQLTLTPNDGSAPIVKDLGNVLTDTVTGLIDGVIYKATLRAVNVNGLSYASTSVVVTSPAPVPVAATNVVGSRSSDGSTIDVTWSAPANEPGMAVSRYVVSLTSTNGAKAISSKSVYRSADGSVPTTATFTGVPVTGSYSVRVLSYSVAGTGPWSTLVPVSSPGAYPAAVNPYQSSVTPTSVKLYWKAAATGLNTPAVTGYKVTMTPLGGTPVVHELGNVLTDTFTGLTEGTLYSFSLQPINSNGVGPTSVSPAKIAPSVKALAPTNVTAVRSSDPTVVEVNWVKPANQPGASITRYIVGLTSTNGAAVPAAKTISRAADGSTATSVVFTGLAANGAYSVKVTPYSSAGTGAVSAATAIPVTNTAVAPDAPTGLSAISGDAKATLSWSAPVVDGGAAVSSYTIEYSGDGGQSWATFTPSNPLATESTVTGLNNGTAYSFKVAAVNSAGKGAYSATASATPMRPISLPGTPQNVAGVLGEDGSINVTWEAPASDGGSAITGYLLESRTLGSADWSGTTVTTTSGSFSAGQAGTAYEFRVSAINADGAGTASGSQVVSTPAVDPTPVDGGSGSGSSSGDPVVDDNTGAITTPVELALPNVKPAGPVEIVLNDPSGAEVGRCVMPLGVNYCRVNITVDDASNITATATDSVSGASTMFPVNMKNAIQARGAKVANHVWKVLNDNFETYAASHPGATYEDMWNLLTDSPSSDTWAPAKVLTRTGSNNGGFSLSSFKAWELKIINNTPDYMSDSNDTYMPLSIYGTGDGSFTGKMQLHLAMDLGYAGQTMLRCVAYLGNGSNPDGSYGMGTSPAWRTAGVNYVFVPGYASADGTYIPEKVVSSLARQGRITCNIEVQPT